MAFFPSFSKIRKVWMAFLVFGFFSQSKAQLNESDTLKHQIRLGINGVKQSGNVDLGIFRSRLEFVTNLFPSLKFKTLNNTLYQEFGGRKADKDISSRNYLYLNPEKRIYPFAIFYAQTNYRRKIDSRYFGGVGSTWQIIRARTGFLKISGSLLYEETRFTSTSFNEPFYQGQKSIGLWRPTFYLSGNINLAENRFALFASAYWQPGIDQVSNQRFQAELVMDFQIISKLSINLQYLFFYDQVVPEKIIQSDGLLTFGLAYHFNKYFPKP